MDELRLVYNMDMTTMTGEDANLNGILDPNENDGDVLPPTDNKDGELNPGIYEYLTVYSRGTDHHDQCALPVIISRPLLARPARRRF